MIVSLEEAGGGRPRGKGSCTWTAFEFAYFGQWLVCLIVGVVLWATELLGNGLVLASEGAPLGAPPLAFLAWLCAGPLYVGLLFWIARVWRHPHRPDLWELGRVALLSLPFLPLAAVAVGVLPEFAVAWPWLGVPPRVALFATLSLVFYAGLLWLRARNRAVEQEP